MRIVFVRHAESVGNADGRLQGHADYSLSEQGRAQAAKLRRRFHDEGFKPTHVYSSPLRRSAETADIVARDWSVPIVYSDDLMEHDVGVFSGLTWEELDAAYPEMAREFSESRDWSVVEGAETLVEQRRRARRVVDDTLGRHTDDDVVMIVTHGGILTHIVAALMGTDRTWATHMHNTTLFDFTLDLSRWARTDSSLHNRELWRVDRFNDASHLSGSD